MDNPEALAALGIRHIPNTMKTEITTQSLPREK